MITITIQDAANESPEALRTTATYLLQLAKDTDPAIEPNLKSPLTEWQTVPDARMSRGPCPEDLTFEEPSLEKTPEEIFKQVAPAVPSVRSVELDSKGIPWDARIHSRNKTRILTGEWKLSRGVDPNLVAKVTQELQNLMTMPFPLKGAGVPLPPIVQPEITYDGLILKITNLINEGALTIDRVNAIFAGCGIVDIPSAANRPDLLPMLSNAIDRG